MPALPDDASLRARAREILDRREYAKWRALDVDLPRWVTDGIARFLAWMDGLAASSPLLYGAVLGGLVLLAGLLLAHVAVSLRAALAGSATRRSPGPEGSDRTPFAVEAESLAAEGRYLEAARRLQLSCIETLLGRGVLELRRFEPNATLRRRLESAALPTQERREFASLLRRLETRIFRDRVEDRSLYEAWLSLHRRLAGGPGRV